MSGAGKLRFTVSMLAVASLAFGLGLLTARLAGPGSADDRAAGHMLIVLSNAHDGADEVFNDWYTGTHLPDVVKVNGFSGAQRFRLSSAQMDDGGNEPYRYLAIYAVDADDVSVPRDALRKNVENPGSMYVDPALDLDRTVAWFYTPITGLVTR